MESDSETNDCSTEVTSHCTDTVQNSWEGKCIQVGVQTCFEDR